MSIYTEEAERRSKECKRHLKGFDGVCAKCNPAPRLVAECWTCTCVDLNLDGNKVREVKPLELYANRLWNEADGHRAAGHDVRERKGE